MRLIFESGERARVVESLPGEKILRAALREGLALRYDCATGTCGACKARLLSGRAESAWPDAPGARRLGPDELLTCQSVALEDCALAVSPSRPDGAVTDRPRSLPGTLRRPRRLTHDVMAFDVELAERLPFAAGQFVLLEVPHITGARAYSISGSAREGREVSLVVKRKVGGRVGDWLFGRERDGAPVTVFGPLGRAVFDGAAARDLLCVAGGTGVAGMLAILRRASDEGHLARHAAHVYFGVRTSSDVFFAEELAALRERHPTRVAITVALSEEEAPEAPALARAGLEVTSGLVHEVMAARLPGPLPNVRAYVAGPRPMVDAAVRALVGAGRVPVGEIRFDRFD